MMGSILKKIWDFPDRWSRISVHFPGFTYVFHAESGNFRPFRKIDQKCPIFHEKSENPCGNNRKIRPKPRTPQYARVTRACARVRIYVVYTHYNTKYYFNTKYYKFTCKFSYEVLNNAKYYSALHNINRAPEGGQNLN